MVDSLSGQGCDSGRVAEAVACSSVKASPDELPSYRNMYQFSESGAYSSSLFSTLPDRCCDTLSMLFETALRSG